jgi:hypothetical protein
MSAKTRAQAASLEKRIRHFYGLLNDGRFEECYRMIDPVIRDKPSSVTLYQYQTSLRTFLDRYGQVRIRGISLDLHLDEPSKLYGDRDFAVGQTIWEDESGEEHPFQERWVRERRSWYTRSSGFVTPETKKTVEPAGKSIASADSRTRRHGNSGGIR